MTGTGSYEVVVGLEVHAHLSTKSKLFCADATAFGAAPNTQVSPVSLGHPGTLPVLNAKAIQYAIKMGLACNGKISEETHFSRKNYFYPDLPKGYQVTQDTAPVCIGGFIAFELDGEEKQVRLNRIHLEEDAGKSLHDVHEDVTAIDYNRAGTPLIEIVSEPDIRSGKEAYEYVSEIRRLVRYLDICDGNMEEGSLRCDVNISLRSPGSTGLGKKVEIKNLNSVRNVKRAIEAETERQAECLRRGEPILQETRSFDADKGTTFPIRDKEDAHDYRYFPEPDLPPFHISATRLNEIKESIPRLQKERIRFYISELDLSPNDARVLTNDKQVADYFEAMVSLDLITAKTAANWIIGPVKTWMNENQKEVAAYPLSPAKLTSLALLVDKKIISNTVAAGKILPALLANPDIEPADIASELNVFLESDTAHLLTTIDKVLNDLPAKVTEYKKGKKGLLSLFVGEVMKRTGGKADPKLTSELLLKKLKS